MSLARVAPLGAVGALSASLVTGIEALTVALATRGRRFARAVTWDCGYAAPSARMEYTPFAFAHPLARVFGLFTGLFSRHEPLHGHFPSKNSFITEARDLVREHLLTPLFEAVRAGCDALKCLQHGRIHLYILYMLVTLVALLVWKLGEA